jgi:pimeloyl-ACP methyl ester carboxylesterase
MAQPLGKLDPRARELAAVARQAWLLRHDGARRVLPAEVRPGDDVVVCLHGLFATAGVLRPLRRRLERHEGTRTATMSYPVGPGIAALARQLAELTAELPPSVRLHLVGHSLGGVVARWYTQELAPSDTRVVETISIGAPFAGVRHFARFALQIARDLDPGSALLRQLALGSRRAGGVPHLSIVGEDDSVAHPPLAHVLPGGDVLVVRACGHNALLFDERVMAAVETRLLDERAEAGRQRATR